MTRDDWIRRFVEALQQLRPHLVTGFGISRIALALAAQAYRRDDEDPEAAARRAHEAMPPPGPKR